MLPETVRVANFYLISKNKQFEDGLLYLEFCGHDQLWSFESHQHIEPHERHDGHEDGEVTDEFPQLGPQTERNQKVPMRKRHLFAELESRDKRPDRRQAMNTEKLCFTLLQIPALRVKKELCFVRFT